MSEDKEKVTWEDGTVVWLSREVTRVKPDEKLKIDKISAEDKNLIPPNFREATGGPMRLIQGDGIGVDLNKRREPMPFWHRNNDYDEFIFCFKGSALWETELGDVRLCAGDMIVIPRGVAHRDTPLPGEQYIAIEIKSSSRLSRAIK